MGLTYVPDFKQFEHLRIYARGYTQIARVFRGPKTKFRKRTMLLDAYQRLIIALKFRDGLELGPYIRSDVVYLRMFKDVPHVDMEMHLPEQGTKVKMRWIDKAQIASPVVMGLPTLAMKILGLLSFAALANPMLLAPLMAVPVTAGMNSFFGFHRAKHKHLSSMIRNLYYLTLANNGSVLNRLVDSAEEEEYKETMLAYLLPLAAARRGRGMDDGAARRPHRGVPQVGLRRRDQLRDRRRPRQALPPRPGPPRRPRPAPRRHHRPGPRRPRPATGTTPSATPEPDDQLPDESGIA